MRKRGLVLSVIVSGALATSGWIPLPLPRSWVLGPLENWAAENDLQADFTAATIEWATGLVRVEGFALSKDSDAWLRVPEIAVHLGLWPGAEDFGEPRLVHLKSPVIDLDSADLERLSDERDEPASELPRLVIAIEDGRFAWRELEQDWSFSARLPRAMLRILPEGIGGHGRVEPSFGGQAQFVLRARPQTEQWEIDLDGRAQPFEWEPGELLPWQALKAEDLRYKLRLGIQSGAARVLQTDVDLREWSAELQDPPLEWRLARCEAFGDLQRGIELRMHGRLGDWPMQAEGNLRSAADASIRAVVGGFFDPIALNEALIEQLQILDPGVAEPVAAFEPRGSLQPDFRLEWDSAQGLRFAARAPLEAATATYRGFAESDGDKPAFPYPMTDMSGQLVAVGGSDASFGQHVLIDMQGRVGAGTVRTQGALKVGGGKAGVSIDATVRGVELDERVRSAAQGTPELAKLLRDLGGVRGGHADLNLIARREHLARKVKIAIDADVRGAAARPVFLPVDATIEHLHLRWQPGLGRFEGEIATLGGRGRLQGQVAAEEGASASAIDVQATMEDLAPSLQERRTLRRYLELPVGATEFELAGETRMAVSYRRPGARNEAQVLVDMEADQAELVLQPEGLPMRFSVPKLVVVRHEDQSLVSLPKAEIELEGGRVGVCVQLARDEASGSSRALFHSEGLRLDDGLDTVLRQRAAADLPWIEQFDVRGRVRALVEVDPSQSTPPAADLSFRPIWIRNRSGAWQAEELQLSGEVSLRTDLIRGTRLILAGSEGEVLLRDFRYARTSHGVELDADLASPRGFEIQQRLIEWLGPDVWGAIERLGLSGRVASDGLQVHVELPDAGPIAAQATGSFGLRDFAIAVPPQVESGSVDFDIQNLSWMQEGGFDARLGFAHATMKASGIGVKDASGQLSINDSSVVLRDFEAEVLGGRVRTNGRNAEGEEEQGRIRVGLSPEAPLRVLLFLEDLSLSQMRHELQLGGSLAGKLSGRIDFRSATPSPLDYVGRGEIEIADGVLGTVPVLSDLWAAIGSRPPQFNEGRLRWVSDATQERGLLRIEELRLDHPLLAVQGEGWAKLDGSLQMKVTVRTFSIFGSLPIVRDIIDVIVEQNVRGPIERPVIRHRATDKLEPGEEDYIPFPLWLPEIPKPDWARSPVIPVQQTEKPQIEAD